MVELQVSSDMQKLTKQGINSFKFFLAYKGAMAVTDEQLLNGLRRAKELGALPMVCSGAAVSGVQQRMLPPLCAWGSLF